MFKSVLTLFLSVVMGSYLLAANSASSWHNAIDELIPLTIVFGKSWIPAQSIGQEAFASADHWSLGLHYKLLKQVSIGGSAGFVDRKLERALSSKSYHVRTLSAGPTYFPAYHGRKIRPYVGMTGDLLLWLYETPGDLDAGDHTATTLGASLFAGLLIPIRNHVQFEFGISSQWYEFPALFHLNSSSETTRQSHLLALHTRCRF